MKILGWILIAFGIGAPIIATVCGFAPTLIVRSIIVPVILIPYGAHLVLKARKEQKGERENERNP